MSKGTVYDFKAKPSGMTVSEAKRPKTRRDENAKPKKLLAEQMLGKCLLGLQRYELVVKAIAADFEISGTLGDLPAAHAVRTAEVERKTLGTLIGILVGSFLVVDSAGDVRRDTLPSGRQDTFGFRVQLNLSADGFANAETDLKGFVLLRNNLVHHFLEKNDLQSVAGCQAALDHLALAFEEIRLRLDEIREWGRDLYETKRSAAEFVQSDRFRSMIFEGSS